MSDTQIVPIVLTPMAVVGTKPKSKGQIKEELAQIKDLNPLSKTNLTSGIGGVVTAFELANLFVNPKAGALSYIITIGGGILTGLGFLISPSLECEKEPEVLSPPVRPAQKTPPAETPLLIPKGAKSVFTAEEISFQEHLERVTSWKKDVLGDLGKREEQKIITSLLKMLNLKTGKSTKLSSENHLKLRKYTLELLIEIILKSDNNRTIERSIKAIFDHLEDNDSKLQYNAGIALALIGNEREDALEKIPGNITKTIIISKLEALQK